MVTVGNTKTSLAGWTSKRNVVVAGCAGDRCGLEVSFVDRDLAGL
jgi:hypothetical protein